jgi:mannosyltransferase
MPPKKLDLFYILIFVLLNAILKSLYISYAEVSLDEPFSMMVALMPLHDIPTFLSQYNNPPLFELLLHPVVQLFGPVTPWVRIPSVVFATLTVVFIYLIGTRFFTRKAGVFASLFYTFATCNIYYAHEARAYALFNLFSCISVFLFLSAKDKDRLHYTHPLLLVVNVLLVYTHYFGFVVWAIQLSWLVLFRYTYFKTLLLMMLTFVVSALLYLPQLNIVFTRFADASKTHWVQTPAIDDLYINLMKMLNAPVVAVAAIILFVAALLKRFLTRQTATTDENTVFVFHWFLSAYLGLFLVSLFVPVFLDRYLIFVSGAVYIGLAISIDYLLGEEKSWPVLGIFVLLFIFSVNLKPDHGRRWKGMVENIAATKTPQTAVFIIPNWVSVNYAYHYNLGYFKDYHHTKALLQHDGYYPINTVAELRNTPLDSFDRVILVDGGSRFVDKNQSVYQDLKRQFPETSTNKTVVGADVITFKR